MQEYLDLDRIDVYLYEQDSSANTEELVNLWKHPVVQNKLLSRWEYESGPKWQNRSEDIALSETVLQTLAHLQIGISIFTGKARGENPFPGYETEQLERTYEELLILSGYFYSQLYSAKK